MIMVLHGFGSNGGDSETCKLIREAFPEEIVMTPTYTSEDPVKAFDDIAEQVLSFVDANDDEEIMFVGISLGAFWARHLANAIDNATLVMFNPSLEPHENLMSRIGENTDYATGKTFELTEENVKKFKKFAVDKDKPDTSIYLVIASNDDVVDYKIAYDKYLDRADITVTSEGGHRLQGQQDLVVNTVRRALNTYQ